LPTDLGRMILEDFLENSGSCIQILVNELSKYEGDKNRKVHLLEARGETPNEVPYDGDQFFLRSSTEYSNPQLTVEDVQGIIAARLLEVCGNYFLVHGVRKASREDVTEIRATLEDPPKGKIVSFLLNTDDTEPDRYSINPLKDAIVKSGQSAFPSARVKTEGLAIDQNFMRKYEGSLISKSEADLITYHLADSKGNYMNMVDTAKYDQLRTLSTSFGIDLCLPTMRMPLSILEGEKRDDLLHYIISEVHKDYGSVERLYNCMGRSMKNRTTLLTVPHSKKGFGSKRAVRGKIYFEGTRLKAVRVTYHTTTLYPNAIDPEDVSIAEAEDEFIVEGDNLTKYDFQETPSSPQFVLYSLGSPEDAALWHGIGEFGASQLVKSYTSTRLACARDSMIRGLERYGVSLRTPLQLNLVPQWVWFHPIHRNIDASVGCVKNLEDLAKIGMRLECLSAQEYER